MLAVAVLLLAAKNAAVGVIMNNSLEPLPCRRFLFRDFVSNTISEHRKVIAKIKKCWRGCGKRKKSLLLSGRGGLTHEKILTHVIMAKSIGKRMKIAEIMEKND